METGSKISDNTARILFLLAVASFLLRIILLGAPELLAEEAYYWNYATHLALGYLDHPPLSAWLIALCTSVFGVSEFTVRFGAFLCSLVTGFFVYRTALLLGTRRAAWLTVSVLSVIPYSMGNFFFISPDAPLVAAWAASIYFMLRIIRLEPRDSGWPEWLGLGCAFGLGLLAKYTIALLALSAGVVFLVEPSLRRWILRPQPYVALILAAVIFSPVIYWNATHEWASLVFQGSRRFAEEPKFSLFDFLGHFIFMGTPIACVVGGLFVAGKYTFTRECGSRTERRFLSLSFAIPVLIFLFFSIRHQPRLNWSGPAFLSLLPFFALHIVDEMKLDVRFDTVLRRCWIPMLFISVVGFAGFWTYCGPGIPFTGYTKKMTRLIGWEDLGQKVLSLAQEQGPATWVLGMDKHYTAAELSFYVARSAKSRNVPTPDVGGRAIVGISSLMFRYWVPESDLTGRDAILVSRNRTDLDFPEVARAFESLGPIVEYHATRNGKPVGVYNYRVGFKFRGKEMINSIRELTKDGH